MNYKTFAKVILIFCSSFIFGNVFVFISRLLLSESILLHCIFAIIAILCYATTIGSCIYMLKNIK